MIRALNLMANLFPVWVVILSLAALKWPEGFTWFKGFIVPGLGIIMLGMGLTLKVEDFAKVLKVPLPIAVGFFGQFLIMPFLGWGIANLMELERAFAVGLILVACCPGGTASNVVTFIARANLPLSLLMTMCSTFGAIICTPILTKLYAGALVDVDGWGLFLSTLQVVLLPVLAGVALNRFFPKQVKFALPISPLISVITIALICAYIIGQNKSMILEHGKSLVIAVSLLHAAGFALGYGFAKLFGYDVLIRRTVAIEVGMQNSGLGTVLANKHFLQQFPTPGNPAVSMAAAPCALSAVFHSVIGSVLAVYWRTRLPKEASQSAELEEQLADNEKK